MTKKAEKIKPKENILIEQELIVFNSLITDEEVETVIKKAHPDVKPFLTAIALKNTPS